MKSGETSIEFIRAFCARDFRSLEMMLCEDLVFTGPLYRFESRSAYLESLESSPGQSAEFEIIELMEDESNVSVFWKYIKPEATLLIAQWNCFRDGLIAEILLVFDTETIG